MIKHTVWGKTLDLAIGDQRYIEQKEIAGSVIETLIREECPQTNRGLDCEDGWLGSWTQASGVTTDSYSRGAHRLTASNPLHDSDNSVFAWELTWEKV